MKTLSLISIVIVLGVALFAGPVHAEDPAALPPELQAMIAELLKMADPAHLDSAQTQKLTPELQAALAQLLKSAMAELPAETAPADHPSTTSTSTTGTAPVVPSAATSGPTNTQDTKPSLGSTGLRTSSLTSGGLMPSAPLGGHGTSGVATRLSEADWRTLFPKKQDSK